MSRLRMFAGPNGSGKSSLYKGLVEEGHFHPTTFLNADEILQRLDAGLHVRFPLDATADIIPRLRCSSFLDHGLTASDIDGRIVDPTLNIERTFSTTARTKVALLPSCPREKT